MSITIKHLVVSDCGRDGVHIEGSEPEISFGTVEMNNIGRDAFHVAPSLQDFKAAGILDGAPEEAFQEAQKALQSRPEANDEEKEEILKSSSLVRWISIGANLATIASLLLNR